MMRSRHSEEQIIGILREQEAGSPTHHGVQTPSLGGLFCHLSNTATAIY
jgi:hypothetical protein